MLMKIHIRALLTMQIVPITSAQGHLKWRKKHLSRWRQCVSAPSSYSQFIYRHFVNRKGSAVQNGRVIVNERNVVTSVRKCNSGKWSRDLQNRLNPSDPAVDSASNSNQYQDRGGKSDRCAGLITLRFSCADCLKILGASTSWSARGLPRPAQGHLKISCLEDDASHVPTTLTYAENTVGQTEFSGTKFIQL